MKLLFTGASGLVGSRVLELWQDKDITVLTPPITEFSLGSKDSITAYFQKNQPQAVIHMAAATNVSAAENERGNTEGLTWKLNVDGTQFIANECAKTNAFLIHISTDMVFSGKEDNKGPYAENHPIGTNPDLVSWYGFSKAEAERAVAKTLKNDQFSIVRISSPVRKDYDLKPDYFKKILMSFDEHKLHPLFADQSLTITFIDELAPVLWSILDKRIAHTFHVSSHNTGSPYEIGEYLINIARGKSNEVKKGSLTEFLKTQTSSARYLQYGGLNVSKTEEFFDTTFNTWQKTIKALYE